MQTLVDKQAVPRNVSKKSSATPLQFNDERSENSALGRLQGLVDGSSRVSQLRSLQRMADDARHNHGRLTPIGAGQTALVSQRAGALFSMPGKKDNENYLGWGGWRIAKEIVSKVAGVKRGVGSVAGGVGRMLGYHLPGTYNNITRAASAPELQACLALAQANNNAIPPWLMAGQLRPAGGNYVPGAGAVDYKAKDRTRYQNKWGSTYYNEDGSLPGVKGAGGYQEFYAQPTTGPCVGIWGSNRILRQTNDPTGTYYWSTNNHYTTFNYINDA